MSLDQYIPKEELVNISLTSVMNFSVFITIALVIMSIFLRKGKLVRKVGPSCIMYLLMALIIRMFIPIEVKFAREIGIIDILTPLYKALNYKIELGYFLAIRVYEILFSIWVSGVVISIIIKFVSYKKIRRYTSVLPKTDTNEIKQRLGESNVLDLLDSVKVAYSKEVGSPYLIGFFKPLIVLPLVEYTDEQLKYIIAHELMHAKNKDIFWKILADILCTIFWWNPIFGFLRDQLFKMIEIRNDREIIKDLGDHEIIGYLECLMNTAIHLSGKNVLFSVSFSKSDFEELKLRMDLVAKNKKYSKKMQIIVTTIVIMVLLLTSMFIIEPITTPSEEQLDGGVRLDSSNTFLIECEDGYEVYVYDEYLFLTNDLRPFFDVPIYESLEEALSD